MGIVSFSNMTFGRHLQKTERKCMRWAAPHHSQSRHQIAGLAQSHQSETYPQSGLRTGTNRDWGQRNEEQICRQMWESQNASISLYISRWPTWSRKAGRSFPNIQSRTADVIFPQKQQLLPLYRTKSFIIFFVQSVFNNLCIILNFRGLRTLLFHFQLRRKLQPREQGHMVSGAAERLCVHFKMGFSVCNVVVSLVSLETWSCFSTKGFMCCSFLRQFNIYVTKKPFCSHWLL